MTAQVKKTCQDKTRKHCFGKRLQQGEEKEERKQSPTQPSIPSLMGLNREVQRKQRRDSEKISDEVRMEVKIVSHSTTHFGAWLRSFDGKRDYGCAQREAF